MSESGNYVGIVEAVIANLRDRNGDLVIDLDGDCYSLTAFRDGQEVALATAEHGDQVKSDGPVGKGNLHVSSTDVHFVGRYFVGTQRGLDEFLVTSEMGSLFGWSPRYAAKYTEPPADLRRRGARRLITSMNVISVAPTIRPAGLNTRTLTAKCISERLWLKQEIDAAIARHLEREIALGVAEHSRMGKQLRALRLVA
jgi:hypothetical protein